MKQSLSRLLWASCMSFLLAYIKSQWDICKAKSMLFQLAFRHGLEQ